MTFFELLVNFLGFYVLLPNSFVEFVDMAVYKGKSNVLSEKHLYFYIIVVNLL